MHRRTTTLGWPCALRGILTGRRAHLRSPSYGIPVPEAHNNLGAVLQKNGDLDRARSEYTRAVELRPTYALAHYNLGDALQRQGEAGRALGEFRACIQSSESDELTRRATARVSRLEGQS